MSLYKCEPYLAVEFKKLAEKDLTQDHISELILEWTAKRRIMSAPDYLCEDNAIAPINFSDGSVLYFIYNDEIKFRLSKVIPKAEVFAMTFARSGKKEAIEFHRSDIKHIVESNEEEKTLVSFTDSSMAIITERGAYILDSINAVFCLIDGFPFKNTKSVRDKPEVH